MSIRTFSRALALAATLVILAPLAQAVQSPIQTAVTNSGGSKMAFNITAIGQIKNGSGRIRRLFVETTPSAGTLVIHDIATGGTAAIGNQITSIPNTALTAGTVILLDAPCASGIAISGTWPTGLVLAVAYD